LRYALLSACSVSHLLTPSLLAPLCLSLREIRSLTVLVILVSTSCSCLSRRTQRPRPVAEVCHASTVYDVKNVLLRKNVFCNVAPTVAHGLGTKCASHVGLWGYCSLCTEVLLSLGRISMPDALCTRSRLVRLHARSCTLACCRGKRGAPTTIIRRLGRCKVRCAHLVYRATHCTTFLGT